MPSIFPPISIDTVGMQVPTAFVETLSKLTFGTSGWGDELLLGALMTVSLAVASVLVGLLIGGKVGHFKDSAQPGTTRCCQRINAPI